jgi:hypothetical protein
MSDEICLACSLQQFQRAALLFCARTSSEERHGDSWRQGFPYRSLWRSHLNSRGCKMVIKTFRRIGWREPLYCSNVRGGAKFDLLPKSERKAGRRYTKRRINCHPFLSVLSEVRDPKPSYSGCDDSDCEFGETLRESSVADRSDR